jgi:hypothetical protein
VASNHLSTLSCSESGEFTGCQSRSGQCREEIIHCCYWNVNSPIHSMKCCMGEACIYEHLLFTFILTLCSVSIWELGYLSQCSDWVMVLVAEEREFNSWQGWRYVCSFHSLQTDCGCPSSGYRWLFLGVKWPGYELLLKLRMSGAVSLRPHTSWHGAWVSTGTNFSAVRILGLKEGTSLYDELFK